MAQQRAQRLGPWNSGWDPCVLTPSFLNRGCGGRPGPCHWDSALSSLPSVLGEGLQGNRCGDMGAPWARWRMGGTCPQAVQELHWVPTCM